MDRMLRDKTLYILVWVIMVCAGILIQTQDTDRLWQIVYKGIYDNASLNRSEWDICEQRGYGKDSSWAETGAGEYAYYWETRVRDVCDAAIKNAREKDKEKDTQQATEEKTEKRVEEKSPDEKSRYDIVTAMADISSSYIGMDADTLKSYCYNVTYPKCVRQEELDAENLLGKDLSLDMDTGGYKVLIYHTHSSEAYADSEPGDVDDTVVGLGQRLADILSNTYGIPVYHDTTPYDMVTGVLDRNASYDYSREGVANILAENPGIEVMIDLHRDGVPDDTHLVTDVDGRQTAQIMLINGMCRDEEGNDVDYWSNDNKIDNMALSLQTYLAGRGNYGDIMRKIFISTSRYNMDLMPRAMLAEIGAQTNTVEEAYNAMEPFAAMLAKVLLK